jgi:dTDP-4-dehydrorhamnose 3,5-epimerase-like enzyme
LIGAEIHEDQRGTLSVFQEWSLPISVQRVYFLYQSNQEIERGGHAHKSLSQLMIATNGSVEVTLDDGLGTSTTHVLRDPSEALYVPPGFWRTIKLTHEATCLVLASEVFDPIDYIHEYQEFCTWKKSHT